MGGDRAPDMVIEGAALALAKNSNLRFKLYGDQAKISPLLEKYSALIKASEIIHTPDFIANEEKPSIALRHSKNSSMRLAVDAVRDGHASGVVSAGNTGAYMAIAKIFLKMIPGIDRPAIIASLPTLKNPCVMLDLGANVVCDHNHLVQFAIMGDVYAQEILGVSNPSIGLLNVGEEEQKGNDAVQEAAKILRCAPNTLNFYGFIEGDDIGKGTVDVVVTDGFTGNVALKALEGMAFFIMTFMKEVFKTSWLARAGYLLSMFAMKKFKNKLNAKNYNGAMLIGLGGVAIKSHGSADGIAFANAIHVAARMVSHDLNKKIEKSLKQLYKDIKQNAPKVDVA